MASTFTTKEERTIQRALRLLHRAAGDPNAPAFSDSTFAGDHLRLLFAGSDREEMRALYLDMQHRLIATETHSIGTIDQCSLYPRELVRHALRHNAAAVILAHNHPSGTAEPSRADMDCTIVARAALACVDIRLLDHFVVTPKQIVSIEEYAAAKQHTTGRRRK